MCSPFDELSDLNRISGKVSGTIEGLKTFLELYAEEAEADSCGVFRAIVKPAGMLTGLLSDGAEALKIVLNIPGMLLDVDLVEIKKSVERAPATAQKLNKFVDDLKPHIEAIRALVQEASKDQDLNDE